MNRLRPTIDLSYGEQEVLQRVLAEPRKIADALAPDDAREHSRIIGVLEEVAAAFTEVFFQVVEQLPDTAAAKAARTAGQRRGCRAASVDSRRQHRNARK